MTQQQPFYRSSERFSLARIAKLGLGGAIGGLVTFVLCYPITHNNPLLGTGNPVDDWAFQGAVRGYLAKGTLLGIGVGFIFGFALVVADQLRTRSWQTIAIKGALGGGLGAIVGALGGLDAQFIFTLFSVGNIPLARACAWSLLGIAVGVCPGAVDWSFLRANLGTVGGLIGGFAGGLFFDALVGLTGSKSLGAASGLMLTGWMIGVFVAVLEETIKDSWLRILTGSREGQLIQLAKGQTKLGASEFADIPLFGDPSVQPLHATITRSGGGARITAAHPSLAVVVNSQPVFDSPLNDGDIISIGKHRMRFGTRRLPIPTAPPIPPQQQPSVVSGHPVPKPSETPSPGTPAVASGLMIVSGPHAGQSFALRSPETIIGRSPECHIPIPNDGLASRQHARIVWDGVYWRIEDCASTNGVFVNGQRIPVQVIRPGDEVLIGTSVMRVG